MKMTVKLTDGSWKREYDLGWKEPRTVTVELVRLTHVGSYELPEYDRRFAVILDGEDYIKRSKQSTDRHSGLVRIPGRGRPAWQWSRRSDGKSSDPGIHEPNRAAAIAEVLGYDFGVQVK